MFGLIKLVLVLCFVGFVALWWFGDDSTASSTPATAPALEVDVSAVTSTHNREVVAKALSAFMKTCAGLQRYLADIDGAKVTPYIGAGGAYDYRTEQYGWQDWLFLQVRVRQEARTIPAHYRAQGHTLNYYLGAGTRPGIAAQKTQSEQVCGGIPTTAEGNGFVDVPALAVVNDLQ